MSQQPRLKADDIRKFVLSITARIQAHMDHIDISLNPINLPRWLGRMDCGAQPSATTQNDTDARFVTLTIPIRLKRVGNEMKMIISDGSLPTAPDPSLVRALVRAHVIRERILTDKTLTLEEIAKLENIVPSYATRLFRLTLMAVPTINQIRTY